jgi:hypothetical protein
MLLSFPSMILYPIKVISFFNWKISKTRSRYFDLLALVALFKDWSTDYNLQRVRLSADEIRIMARSLSSFSCTDRLGRSERSLEWNKVR